MRLDKFGYLKKDLTRTYTGTWTTVTKTPMGDQKVVMELVEKDGVLTGIAKSDKETVDVTNGQVDGTSATWDIAVTKPMKITLGHTIELDGDSFRGNVKLGVFGNAKIEGTRA